MDIYWRDASICPTEDDYRKMVIQKTGGLFGLGVRLMQLFSDRSSTDLKPLLDNLGLFFQIRDDYANLCSKEYSDAKTFCEDLTEGKFRLEQGFSSSLRYVPPNNIPFVTKSCQLNPFYSFLLSYFSIPDPILLNHAYPFPNLVAHSMIIDILTQDFPFLSLQNCSFLLLHGIQKNQQPESNQIRNIIRQRTTEVDVKKYCVQLLRQTGSFDYAADKLKSLKTEIEEQLNQLGGNAHLQKLMNDLASLYENDSEKK